MHCIGTYYQTENHLKLSLEQENNPAMWRHRLVKSFRMRRI